MVIILSAAELEKMKKITRSLKFNWYKSIHEKLYSSSLPGRSLTKLGGKNSVNNQGHFGTKISITLNNSQALSQNALIASLPNINYLF